MHNLNATAQTEIHMGTPILSANEHTAAMAQIDRQYADELNSWTGNAKMQQVTAEDYRALTTLISLASTDTPRAVVQEEARCLDTYVRENIPKNVWNKIWAEDGKKSLVDVDDLSARVEIEGETVVVTVYLAATGARVHDRRKAVDLGFNIGQIHNHKQRVLRETVARLNADGGV